MIHNAPAQNNPAGLGFITTPQAPAPAAPSSLDWKWIAIAALIALVLFMAMNGRNDAPPARRRAG